MEKKLQHAYEDTFALYSRLVTTLRWTQQQIKDHSSDMDYNADVAFVMSELDKLLKDIGVEVRNTRRLSEKMACKEWIMGQNEEPIRTEYCTASPRLKLQPAMPKKGTPELKALKEWLGVIDNHEAFSIHWPTLCDIVTEGVENGKPIPKCIDPGMMHEPSAVLQFRKKKGIMDE